MHMHLATFHGAVSYPLASGDAGIEQTIGLIRRLVNQGVKTPIVNETAILALREGNAAQFDQVAEARAVYEWVQRNIRYVADPVSKETVRPADVILGVGAGDCDDINGVLIPSMLGTIGIPTRLVTVAVDPAMPDQFTHVYAEGLADGRWIALDSARVGASFGLEPQIVYRRQYWTLNAPDAPVVGRLNGIAGLSFDWGALFQAAPDIAQGTAQIISAARGYPTYPQPYQYPGITTGAGIPGRGTVATATAATNISPMLLVAGAALVAILIFRK
jgi:hypothetical protein